jgi:hypothetical protein
LLQFLRLNIASNPHRLTPHSQRCLASRGFTGEELEGDWLMQRPARRLGSLPVLCTPHPLRESECLVR